MKSPTQSCSLEQSMALGKISFLINIIIKTLDNISIKTLNKKH